MADAVLREDASYVLREDGFKVLLETSGGGIVNAGLVTMGFGTANTHKLVLDGFVANPGGGGTGGFYIFGDSVIS